MTNSSFQPTYNKASKLALALVGLSLSLATHAETLSSGELQAQVLAAACFNCHGTDGRLDTSIPAIAGRPVKVLTNRLLAFKTGEKEDATVMQRHAQGYTEAEITALAEYFSKIKP